MRIGLLFLCLLAFTAGQAQKDVGGFFQLSIGAGIPQGDFISSVYNDLPSGYDQTGVNLSMLFGHKIHKQWGGFVQFNLGAHALNTQTHSAYLHDVWYQRFNWTVEPAIWTISGFTFGPQFSQNFKKSAIDIRFGIGALNFFLPEIKAEGKSFIGANERKYVQKENRTSALTLGGGLTYKYEIKWSWVLLANIDYYRSNPIFNNIETELNGSAQPLFNLQPTTFDFLHTGIGLGYVF